MDFELKLHNQKIRGILENEHAKDVVILAHGYTGNTQGPDDIFIKLSGQLQRNNFAVIRFAFRGTDPSDGHEQDMTLLGEVQDLQAVIDWARSKQGFQTVSVVGESFAGGVLAKAYQDQIDAVVFWYPLFDFKDCSFREYLNDFNKQKLERDGYIEIEGFKVGKQLYKEIAETVLYDKVAAIKAPVLFLHGDMDTDVPVQQSRKAFELTPGIKEIGILEGADHCFKTEQEEAIALTLDFLDRQLRPQD